MKTKEFNLSDKIIEVDDYTNDEGIFIEDVKEFIRLLKEELRKRYNQKYDFNINDLEWALDKIDELAGDKLTWIIKNQKEGNNG